MCFRKKLVVSYILLSKICFLSSLHAADGNWTKAGDGDWNNGANWESSIIPNNPGDQATFDIVASDQAGDITFDVDVTLGSLIFGEFSEQNIQFITSTAKTLTFDNNGSGATILDSDNGFGWDRVISVDVILSDSLTLNLQNTMIAPKTPFEIAGIISGSNGITKTGIGILNLSAVNTYTGATTISGGTLALKNSGAIAASSGVTVNSGGTFSIANVTTGATIKSLSGEGTVNILDKTFTLDMASDSEFSGSIQGASTDSKITKLGVGKLTLSGVNTYNGLTTVSAGTLSLNVYNAIPNDNTISVSGSAVLEIGDINGTLNPFDVTNIGTVTFTTGTGNTTIYAGNISSTGAVTKTGAGTTVLSGTNTHSGGTTVSAGTLQVDATDSMSGSVTVAGSSTFKFGDINGSMNAFNIANSGTVAFTTDTGKITNYGGTISGTGVMTKSGAGTTVLTAQNTYTGLTTVSAGTLQVDATNSIASAVTLESDAFFTFGNIDGTMNVFNIDNSGKVYFTAAGSNTTTYGGSISGNGEVTKLGAGTAVLTGSNSYSGTTAITEGTLQLDATDSLASDNSVSLDTGASLVVDAASGTLNLFDVTSSGTTKFQNTGSLSYGGNVSGIGDVEKTGGGTLTMSGTNDYTGTTTISAGAITFSSLSAIPASSLYTIDSGTQVTFTGNANGAMTNSLIANSGTAVFDPGSTFTLTYPGDLSGNGAISVTQGGTLVLSGVNTYTSNLSVSSDTLLGTTLHLGSTTAIPPSTTVTLSTLDASYPSTLLMKNINGTMNDFDITNNANCRVQFSNNSAEVLTYPGVISSGGGVDKLGDGTVKLTGINTYTGTTDIKEGILQVNAADTISSSSTITVFSNGTFKMNDINGSVSYGIQNTGTVQFEPLTGNTTTYGGEISGTGGVTKSGDGETILTAENIYTGSTSIISGTLKANLTSSISASSAISIFSDGDFTFGDINGTMNAFNITNNGNVNFTTDGGNTTSYGGTISGLGNVTKTNGGKAVLTAQNTYSGTTTVSEGTLQVDNVNGISSSSSVSVESGANFTFGDINGTMQAFDIINDGTVNFTTTGLNATVYGGEISSSGSLIKTGAGAVYLINDNISRTGTTTVSAGILGLSESDALGSGGVTVASGAELFVDNVNGQLSTETIANEGFVNFQPFSGTETQFAGTISGGGAVFVSNVGKVVFTNTNTYTGLTTINGGTLQINVSDAINTQGVVSNNGTFIANEINGTLNSFNITGTGSVKFSTGSQSTTYGGAHAVISNSNSVIKEGSGTFTFNGTQTYSGATSLNAGTTYLNATLSNSNVTVASGATLRGTGTMQDLTVNGTVFPGNSIGTLVVAGNYVQATGSTLQAEIQAPNLADLIDVTGTATIQSGATLHLIPLGSGFEVGQVFTLIDATGGLTGTFSTINIDDIEIIPFQIEETYTGTTFSITLGHIVQSSESLGSLSMLPEMTNRINRQQVKNLNKVSDLQWMRNICNSSNTCMKKGLYLYGITSALAGGYYGQDHNDPADYGLTSTSVGVDYLFNAFNSVGAFLGYNAANIKTANLKDKDRVNSASGGIRGQYTPLRYFAVDCTSVFSYNYFNDYRKTRHPHNTYKYYRLGSNPETFAYSLEARVKGNYCIKNALRIQPYVSALYSLLYTNDYRESGVDDVAFKVDSACFNLLTGEAGFTLSGNILHRNTSITLYQKSAYLFEIYNPKNHMHATTLDGYATYNISIDPLRINCVQLGFGMEVIPNRKSEHNIFAEFNSYFSSGQKATFEGVLGLRAFVF